MSVWLAMVGLLALITAAVVIVVSSREPLYDGHPLSYWIDQLPAKTGFSESGWLETYSFRYTNSVGTASDRDCFAEVYGKVEMSRKASLALDRIGEKGCPYLIARLRHRDSAFKLKCIQWATRFGWVKPSFVRADEFRSGQALTALLMLGDRARGAIPELRALAVDKNPSIRAQARRVLSDFAPEELKTLRYEEKPPKNDLSESPRTQVAAA